MIIMFLEILKGAIPTAGVYVREIVYASMPIVILLVGMMILLSTVGLKVSNNLGSTMVGGVFKGIGYITKGLIKIVKIIFLWIIGFIPSIFRKTRVFCTGQGIDTVCSNIIAFMVATIVLLIII